MLYLLDANTLINAKNWYYPFDRVPEFWAWLAHQGETGNLKLPIEIFEEITDPNKSADDKDELSLWAESKEVKDSILLDEDSDIDLVRRVTYGGYLANPTEDDLEKMGRDPFLIAHALKDPSNRTVVSAEVSKPSRKNANRHVPDVAADFEIRCIDTFTLIRELDFSTNWADSA